MVKRPKSPEINEDVRYFTVYQPFPLHANWIVPEEAARCANWIAECVGTAHIFAIHYKPKARGMILLEISKRFTDHGRLLGEHRWNEMLKNPTHEESQNVSRIFHSFYTTLRDAQKDGWKVIHIKPDWFKGWMPGEGEFRDPYPETRWCEVPPEDKTNKPLCRPIPREQKPPPPRNQAPGTSTSMFTFISILHTRLYPCSCPYPHLQLHSHTLVHLSPLTSYLLLLPPTSYSYLLNYSHSLSFPP
ncbi:hypothetical protein CPB84DRAFT_862391 [Gymnopilus junonius]|uniref:Uncharacterized protein n=1 Tax=Gymnopilus junonius TaxID=109634 RepID=A0A9P5NRT4_GYMJU|nr:hypothetical protein CPB84DRAFT_862391 [Gymnopilus junonius]